MQVFNMCMGEFLRMVNSTWWYSFMVGYDNFMTLELWLSVEDDVLFMCLCFLLFIQCGYVLSSFGLNE